MNENYSYEVDIEWDIERNGTLSSPILPTQIEVTTPPEFPKGKKNIQTPEHLFIAAVNSCLMATFLAIAENSKLEFVSFDCNAVGKVEKVDGKLIVSEITLKPRVVIIHGEEEPRVIRILDMSEKACAISNSIKSKIILVPKIIINEKIL